MFLSSAPSTFDLFPKPVIKKFINTPWMKELLLRHYYETEFNITTQEGKLFWEDLISRGQVPAKIFPTPLDKCI